MLKKAIFFFVFEGFFQQMFMLRSDLIPDFDTNTQVGLLCILSLVNLTLKSCDVYERVV